MQNVVNFSKQTTKWADDVNDLFVLKTNCCFVQFAYLSADSKGQIQKYELGVGGIL